MYGMEGDGGVIVTPEMMDPRRLRNPFFHSGPGLDPEMDPFAPAPQMGQGGQPQAGAPQPPTVTAPAGSASAEPQVQAVDPTQPYREKMAAADSKYQSSLDQYAQQPGYEPHHRGTLSRIGEAALGMFSPYAANAIFERPEQERYQRYQAGEQRQQRVLGALQNVSKDSERNLQLAQQQERDKAYTGWMTRRNSPTEGRTQKVVGADGKVHVFQFNDQTGKYDQDMGLAPPESARKEAPPTVTTGKGVMQWNPHTEKYDIPLGPPVHPERPSADETKYHLYKSDPDAFSAIYGDKGDQASAKSDDAIMKMAVAMEHQSAQADFREPDAAKVMEHYTKLKAAQSAAKAMPKPEQAAAAAGSPAPAAAPKAQPKGQPKAGDTRTYLGKPYKFNGRAWVLTQAGGRAPRGAQ
jgi:hypothetical protein